MLRRVLLIAGCAVAVACSVDRGPGELFGPSESGTIVVDALLIVDHPLPDLFVRQTVAPGDLYTDGVSAVRDADVVIRQDDRSFRYRSDPDCLGRYLPPMGAPRVAPGTEYHLTVRSDGREVRAVTRTPGRFRVRESVLLDERTLEVTRRLKTFADGGDLVFTAPENQVVYQQGLLEARFERIDVPGYQVGILSLDYDSERVIDADFLEEDDYEGLERHGSSPAFEGVDGTVRLPWFAVYFAGRHLVKVYALDRNWFDFARSSPENVNSFYGGLAGDNFERPLFRLEGGIGLFGSAAMDSLGFVVLPRAK